MRIGFTFEFSTNLQADVLLGGAGGRLVLELGQPAEGLVLLLHLGLKRPDLVLQEPLALLPLFLLLGKFHEAFSTT